MTKAKPMPERPRGCSESAEYDSRGPGWYCCQDNRYNENRRTTCQDCSHRRCKEGE